MAFRTQKISQMTPKGADLEATDLIEVSTIESGSYVTRSITGQEIIDAAVGNVDWGDIGGTLSNQTDLQNALDAKVPTSRTLTINGVTQDLSADRTFTISTGITIGTTAIASGVVGRVLFEGTGNVVQESSSLFWDNTNGRLGIGTSTAPSGSVYIDNSGNDVKQHLVLKNSDAGSGAQVHLDLHNNVAGSSYSSGASLFLCSSTHAAPYASALGFWNYLNGPIALATNSAERMRVAASGNVLIGTTTDAGFRLDVNGTARVKTDLKIETATGGLIIEGDAGGYPTLKINTLRSGTTRRNWMFATEQFNGGDFVLFRSATAGGVANTLVYSIFNDGNFGLNTSTNAGFRLDVNGTARVSGQLTCSGSLSVSVGGIQVASGGNGIRWGSNVFAISSVNGVLKFSDNSDADFNRLQFGGTTSAFPSIKRASNNIEIKNADDTFGAGLSVGASLVASAILQADSTTKGFLPPRMTTTQKNAIASPAAGLMVYDTTLNVISYYNGSMWI